MKYLICSEKGDLLDVGLRLKAKGHEVEYECKLCPDSGKGLLPSRSLKEWDIVLRDYRQDSASNAKNIIGNYHKHVGRDEIAKLADISVPYHKTLESADAAEYIRQHPGRYRMSAHSQENYIGEFKDGSDCIEYANKHSGRMIAIERIIDGPSIGMSVWFDGTKIIYPPIVQFDSSNFYSIRTGVMGCAIFPTNRLEIFWHIFLKSIKLFRGYKGQIYMELAIDKDDGKVYIVFVKHDGIHFPEFYAEQELLETPISDVFQGIIAGDVQRFKVRKAYAVAVRFFSHSHDTQGTQGISERNFKYLHLSGVSSNGKGFQICSDSDFPVTATGSGDNLDAARLIAYDAATNIIIPQSVYRRDIGLACKRKEYMLRASKVI